MGFSFFDILKLKLIKEKAPTLEELKGLNFPQKIPSHIFIWRLLNVLVNIAIPLIFDKVYAQLSKDTIQKNSYNIFLGFAFLAVCLQYGLSIINSLLFEVYKYNVRRQLGARIIDTNFADYLTKLKQQSLESENKQYSMDLYTKITMKLSIYINNYYDSYLSIIFDGIYVIVIIIYLFVKLSFSVFFGLAIAGTVMYMTNKVTKKMQQTIFRNVERRAKKIKILETFLSRITQFKMCWLDKWINNKVGQIQNEYQKDIRQNKMLDCWCVALWQFTTVSITTIIISAYFYFGFNKHKEQSEMFNPGTFVYLLNMLNNPLNGLSWYIAGLRNAKRAIQELKQDIRISNQKSATVSKIKIENIEDQTQNLNLNQSINPIKVNIEQSIQKLAKGKLKKNYIYSIVGKQSQKILEKMLVYFEKDIKIGYVQENAWLLPSALQSIHFAKNKELINQNQQSLIATLMELFHCFDIPLNNSTQNYSGGQKLRVCLTRAFYLGQIIIINSDLTSLDQKMRKEIQINIKKLASRKYQSFSKDITIFIRGNQQISNQIITISGNSIQNLDLSFEIQQQPIIEEQNIKAQISISISNYLSTQINMPTKQQISQQDEEKANLTHNKEQNSISLLLFWKYYYKSKKHIIFVFSLILVTFLSNYHYYYVNTYIDFAHLDYYNIKILLIITLLFTIGLYFRSFYFADANLEQSVRICHALNNNIIMNQLSFYQSEDNIEKKQLPTNKRNLIYALTNDSQTIASRIPFETNIFANNITVILSCVTIITLQVPLILILVVFLLFYTNKLNQESRQKYQIWSIKQKKRDAKIYEHLSLLENGKKWIVIYKTLDTIKQKYVKAVENTIQLEWLRAKYRNYIDMKYKGFMLLFLMAAVICYSILNVYQQSQKKSFQQKVIKSSGLALIINYTIRLSHYLLHFTMSIWQIKAQAVSLDRVKNWLEQTSNIKRRKSQTNLILQKMNRNKRQQLKSVQKLVNIKQFNYAYPARPDVKVLKQFNLQISQGDKIVIKGKSGAGKTTIYKLLSSVYPEIIDYTKQNFLISFSPQHPLILPETQSIRDNINPYNLRIDEKYIKNILQEKHISENQKIEDLNYQQKIIINNIRAYLHGLEGIVIYDEPQIVIGENNKQATYLVVTHHRKFNNNKMYTLDGGSLIEMKNKVQQCDNMMKILNQID